MNVGQYQYVEKWDDESDLAGLPASEDDQHEYKGSAISDDDLGKEISVAASAFWNSGGGIFVAGINKNTGKVDGGIAEKKGNQPRLEWVDQKVAETQPPGHYLPRWIDTGTSINPNHGVLVIAFGESQVAPHMAYDQKHYVRLGRHSLPARYYLVEAIRARKFVQTPIVRALLRRSDRRSRVVELGILVINEAAALNVQINFDPLPIALFENFRDRFPLQIQVIDRSHPFHLELYSWGLRPQIFGEDPVDVIIEYEDAVGHKYQYTQVIDVRYGIDPMTIGDTDLEAVNKTLQDISTNLRALHETVNSLQKERNKPYIPPDLPPFNQNP